MNLIFSTTWALFLGLQREFETFRVHPGFNGFDFGNTALVIVAFTIAFSGMALVFRRCFGRY
jgi:hypothetical protein